MAALNQKVRDVTIMLCYVMLCYVMLCYDNHYFDAVVPFPPQFSKVTVAH